MSTVVANSISGCELFLFADTIVTRTGDENAKSGRTSHGEVYQPITIKDGTVVGFSESACKVGRLNDRLTVAFAGDVNFSYSILDFLFSQRQNLLDSASIFHWARVAVTNLSPSSYSVGSHGEMLFCVARSELEICRCIFEVCTGGQINLVTASNQVSTAQAFQIVIGSGKEFLQSYLPKDLFNSCAADPTLLSLGVQMLSMDFSRELRRKTRDEAVGVGGAFLGLKVEMDGVKLPRDTVHISVRPDGEVQYLTKISYDGGLFFITDFIHQSINVVRTVDAELFYRANKTSFSTDITVKVRHASKFAAPVILLSYYSDGESLIPRTDIIENAGDDALTGNGPKDGYIWFERNTPVSFRSSSGKQLVFRIP